MRYLKVLVEFHRDHPEFKLHLISLETKMRIVNVDDKQITIWPVQEFLESLLADKIWN